MLGNGSNGGNPPIVPPSSPLLMAYLWERMTHLYAFKWTSQFGEAATDDQGALTETARTWATVLSDVTYQQVAYGLDRCKVREYEWPPVAPKFRAMCRPRPEDHNLPPADVAFSESVRNSTPHTEKVWSHKAVELAANTVGPWDLVNLPPSATRPRFDYAYRLLCERVMSGEVLEEPVPKALPRTVKLTPEQHNERIELIARGERLGLRYQKGEDLGRYKLLLDQFEGVRG